MNIRNRIQQLLTAINQGVYEKDTELSCHYWQHWQVKVFSYWVLRE